MMRLSFGSGIKEEEGKYKEILEKFLVKNLLEDKNSAGDLLNLSI